MDICTIFNLFEAIFWIFVAALCLARSLTSQKREYRKYFRLLSVGFFFFGISDFVEAKTGAWWVPWWLVIWKGACIIELVWSFVGYYIAKKQEDSKRP
jgi:hypothetical protein